MTKRRKPRKARESWVEMTELVMPVHTNTLGTLFGGQLVAWIDLAAAMTAARHARNVCVTASIDSVHFHRPIHQGSMVILKAAVNYTGRTSMEVGVRVESENPKTGERDHTTSAYLTLVSLASDEKPMAIPPIVPSNNLERKRWSRAEERRRYRLQAIGK